MKLRSNWFVALMGSCLLGLSSTSGANDVAVEHARFTLSGGKWAASVRLRHADTGWKHYADAWRVVGVDGTVFGKRVLHHPHENEQPFTRSLSGISIPASASVVFVEAHDSVHGWSPDRIRVDLNVARGERFEVRR
ncbi:MAG: hypothetical protein AAF458_08200 [Pseudomonadota bacterium]